MQFFGYLDAKKSTMGFLIVNQSVNCGGNFKDCFTLFHAVPFAIL